MSRTMKKKDVIAEIVASAGLSQQQAAGALNKLVEIALREARRGFRIPGLCKLSVAHRKARKGRNPITGAPLVIGAHDVLKISPLKRARDTVVPRKHGLVQPGQVADSSPAVAEIPLVPPVMDTFILFVCRACGQEIEATADLAGNESQCPACTMPLTVPLHSEPPSRSSSVFPDLRSKTIRIELPDGL